MTIKYILFATLFFCSQFFLCSCDMNKFAAGGYPYAEYISIDCPSDSVIRKLTMLKSTGNYDDISSFSDGPGVENKSLYNFYFFSHEEKFLLHLSVIYPSRKKTTILLTGIKDVDTKGEWQEINRDIPQNKQAAVLNWFKGTIMPSLICR